MARIGRSCESPQPVLALGHGPIQWSTFPESARERVLALWMQMLIEYLACGSDDKKTKMLPAGPGTAPSTEVLP